MKIREKKSEFPSEKPWSDAPTRVSQERICSVGFCVPRQPECIRTMLSIMLRYSAPLRAPRLPDDLIFPYLFILVTK